MIQICCGKEQILTAPVIKDTLLKKGYCMDISLPPQLKELVEEQVASGRYQSPMEVMSEALRLLQAQEHFKEAKLAALRQDVESGFNSGEAVKIDRDNLLQEARTHYRQTRSDA